MYYLLVKHLRFFFEKHSLEPHWQQEMPVGHFHRGAFSIHYVYYAAAAKYTCQCLKKPKEEVKTEQKMSGHAIFDHICKSLVFCRKKRTTDRKDFLYRNLKCSIFVTGLLKILLFWWNSMINTSVAALKQVLSFPL